MTSTMTVEYGDQIWRNAEGQIHRPDGPAYINPNGTQEWWVDGKLHRLGGPAYIGCNGSKAWCVNGNLHRLDGPAVIRPDGTQEWWANGNLHRLDGPAIIGAGGSEYWYVDDNHVDPSFISRYIKHNPPTPKEQKLLIDYWGKGSS